MASPAPLVLSRALTGSMVSAFSSRTLDSVIVATSMPAPVFGRLMSQEINALGITPASPAPGRLKVTAGRAPSALAWATSRCPNFCAALNTSTDETAMVATATTATR